MADTIKTIAISDVGTMLYNKTSPATSYSELIEITGAPATGSDASQIEVTTLKSKIKQYIKDRKEVPAMNFTFNYTEDNYKKVVAIENQVSEFIYKFQDGSGFYLKAEPTIFVGEASRGSAISATLNLTVQEIEWKTKSEIEELIPNISL